MPEVNKTANRVIKNTGFLYAKMGITMFISLYTTRLILNALGSSDFGIYSVVGGAISMLGFLHVAMSSATQRFMSFYQGKGDEAKQKEIFNVSLVLHFGIAIFLGVILLIAGYFFFNGVLSIPEGRVYAAKIVFGSLIISTMFTVMSVPYEAVLNAHENMLYYSIVGVIESVLKLSVAFIVVNYLGDKLELYGILMACIPLLVLTVMRVYCHKKYKECIIAPKRFWDKSLLKEMTSFAGWNFLSISSGMISQYGMGIVLNNFFGVILNTALGIANQLNGQLMAFSNNMMKAVNPVIMKSEGAGNRTLMLKTSMLSAKFSYLMLAFFAIPFIIETPYILKVWLKNIPDWAIIFVRLQLLRSLVEQLSLMISKTIDAQGDIKSFTIVSSIVNILPILLSMVLFYLGFPPYYLYIVWIICWGILKGIVILNFAHRKCNLNYKEYFFKVVYPTISISVIVFGAGYLVTIYKSSDFLRLILVSAVTTLTFISVYAIGLITKEEKLLFSQLLKKVLPKK